MIQLSISSLLGATLGSLLLDVVVALGLLLTRYYYRISPFTGWPRSWWLGAGFVLCLAGDGALFAIFTR
jgi:hypothetical protein